MCMYAFSIGLDFGRKNLFVNITCLFSFSNVFVCMFVSISMCFCVCSLALKLYSYFWLFLLQLFVLKRIEFGSSIEYSSLRVLIGYV